VEALITELAGVPVHEHCGRSERPRCCLDAALSETPHKKGEEDSWDR
jgi:hypothetical protein